MSNSASAAIAVKPEPSPQAGGRKSGITRSPPSLAMLCMATVASKIERYPPEALQSISDAEWESIVQVRHTKTAPKQSKQAGAAAAKLSGGIDGTGRAAPAISDKVMRSIEESNPHLAKSVKTDRLIWKDCVEYRFKAGAQSRPMALLRPWPILVERLQRSGSELLGLLKEPTSEERGVKGDDDARVREQRMRNLDRSIRVMSDAPMCVALLTASGVGKAVQKFIKGCSKMRPNGAEADEVYIPSYMVDVWTERQVSGMPGLPPASRVAMSPLQQLERLLQGWKDVASAQGVAVSQKGVKPSAAAPRASLPDDCSGRGKKTSEQQHAEDMQTLQRCKSWRDLHAALVVREAKMMANHGAKMRQIRENLEADRHKTRKVTLKHSGRKARHEAILSGQRGARAAASSSSPFYGGGTSKMQDLRKESVIATSWRKNGVAKVTKAPGPKFGASIASARAVSNAMKNPVTSSFGAAIANVHAPSGRSGTKRAGVGRSGQALGAGKRAKKNGTGVFASITQKQGKTKYGTKGGSLRR